MELFEKGTRRKLRFAVGSLANINIEDLFDVPLESLDERYQELNREVDAGQGDSLLAARKPTTAFRNLKLRCAIIKRVIEIRLADAERAGKAAVTRERTQELLRLRKDRQNDGDKELTIEEIDAQLAAGAEEEDE